VGSCSQGGQVYRGRVVGYQVITLHPIEGSRNGEFCWNLPGACPGGTPLPPSLVARNGPPRNSKSSIPEAAGHELGDVRSAAAVIKVVAIPW